jgi:hypothetical protein
VVVVGWGREGYGDTRTWYTAVVEGSWSQGRVGTDVFVPLKHSLANISWEHTHGAHTHGTRCFPARCVRPDQSCNNGYGHTMTCTRRCTHNHAHMYTQPCTHVHTTMHTCTHNDAHNGHAPVQYLHGRVGAHVNDDHVEVLGGGGSELGQVSKREHDEAGDSQGPVQEHQGGGSVHGCRRTHARQAVGDQGPAATSRAGFWMRRGREWSPRGRG